MANYFAQSHTEVEEWLKSQDKIQSLFFMPFVLIKATMLLTIVFCEGNIVKYLSSLSVPEWREYNVNIYGNLKVTALNISPCFLFPEVLGCTQGLLKHRTLWPLRGPRQM